ncbi:MAG: cupin domain-containing protein [Betaproteobacteria bacterium]|nr:cupin domain-containing protein [Betaproteobacteria bacterium]
MSEAEKAKPHPLLKAQAIQSMPEIVRVHRLNPKAIRHARSLGDAVGLSAIGVHLVRIKPGDASTELHFHHQDEEFIFVLSGRGVAEIGEEKFEVGPGDFTGFVAGSLPHAMTNPFAEDLVYLMGGNRYPFDVSDYPRVRKRRYRENGVNEYVSWNALEKASGPGR